MSALMEFVKEAGKGLVAEFGIDAFADAYHSLVVKFAERYLDDGDAQPKILSRFRPKFIRMLRISVYILDEIDGYIRNKNIDRWKDVEPMFGEPMAKMRRKRLKGGDDE